MKIDSETKQNMSVSFATRRVPIDAMRYTLTGIQPTAGDLVLAKVEALGHHRKLHLPDARRRNLFVGDEIVVAYANRYASSQFESYVPEDLGMCHLVAGGGIASKVAQQHDRMQRGPTLIRPIGLVASEAGGPPLNVAGWALPPPLPAQVKRIPVLAIVGTAMDAGKTTTAAYLTKGLTSLGQRVGYGKVTGTGASGDPGLVSDAGANPVLDFTDLGYASTYCVPPREIEHICLELIGHFQAAEVDVILLEIADGLLQSETASLLTSSIFRKHINGVILASSDAMGALAGASWLEQRDLAALAVCGPIVRSPLQLQEAKEATGLPVYTLEDLADGSAAAALMTNSQDSNSGVDAIETRKIIHAVTQDTNSEPSRVSGAHVAWQLNRTADVRA